MLSLKESIIKAVSVHNSGMNIITDVVLQRYTMFYSDYTPIIIEILRRKRFGRNKATLQVMHRKDVWK